MRKYLMLLVLIGMTAGVTEAQEGKKNVLFIAIDDMKPLLGSYGYDFMHTPNMDQLASEGVVFEKAYCQQAVCGPSRASLLTGMRPDYTGVWDLRTRMRDVNPEILAMPEYFRNNGYNTVAIGKIYDPRCVDKSYDEPSWETPYSKSSRYTYPEEWGEPALSYYVDPQHKEIVKKYEAEADEKGIKNKHGYVTGKFKPSTECYDAPDDAYMDGQIANNALKYLDQLSKGDEAFFLAVGFKRPHLPFAAPKKYWDLYEREEVQLAQYQTRVVNGVEVAYHNHGELQSYTDIPELQSFSDIFDNLIDEDKQRELIHGYYASVSFIDAQVGKIMAKLKELGLDKNTVVVLWGDHGWHLGDHALWCKHSNFEHAAKVPLIFSLPGEQQGRYKYPVEFVDIFPTLCEASGIETPGHLQGKSLVPAIQNQEKAIKKYAVSQFDRGKNHGYSIRTERYRLTVWLKEDFRTFERFDKSRIHDCELYDYAIDPNETKNLYSSRTHQKVAKQLMKHFEDYVAQQNIELKVTGAKSGNKGLVKEGKNMKMDGSFSGPLEKSWKAWARNGGEADYVVLETSELGDKTLEVNVTKLGAKPWDVAMKTIELTNLKKGQKVSVSFKGRGGEVKLFLTSEDGARDFDVIELGSTTFLQKASFTVPENGSYVFKLQFNEIGKYLIDDIKAEIE